MSNGICAIVSYLFNAWRIWTDPRTIAEMRMSDTLDLAIPAIGLAVGLAYIAGIHFSYCRKWQREDEQFRTDLAKWQSRPVEVAEEEITLKRFPWLNGLIAEPESTTLKIYFPEVESDLTHREAA